MTTPERTRPLPTDTLRQHGPNPKLERGMTIGFINDKGREYTGQIDAVGLVVEVVVRHEAGDGGWMHAGSQTFFISPRQVTAMPKSVWHPVDLDGPSR